MDLQQFNTLFPHASNDIFNAILKCIDSYKITNLVMFLAQTSEESGRFTQFSENLNYSANRLMQVWPNRFDESNADDYAYAPEKLANNVYANRMGNGDEDSGDGWKYRGRGAIQMTGKNLYSQFAKFKHMDLEAIVSYMETSDGIIDSACWYWTTIAKVNKYAQRTDVPTVTRIINGGFTNLNIRYAEFDRIASGLKQE